MRLKLEKNSTLQKTKLFYAGIVLLIVCATIVRLAYFFSYHPPLVPYAGDSPVYDVPAWNIVQGNGYVYELDVPFASREPGYAFFLLVPTYAVFGHSLSAVVGVQYVLDILMMLMVVWFLRRKANELVALLGGALYLAYLPFVFQSGEILTETAYQFWLLISTGIFILAANRKSWWLMGIAGMALGYTTLVRWGAFVLPAFFFIAIIIITRQWRATLKLTISLCIGAVLITSGWLVRNYITFDQFIFGRTGGGEIYWSGSYIPYDGEWRGDTAESQAIRGDLPLLEYEKKFTQAAIENIKADPVGVAWLWLKKPFKIYIFPEALNYMNRTGQSTLSIRSPVIFISIVGAILLHWLLLLAAGYGLWRNRTFDTVTQYAILAVLIFSLLIYMPLNPVPRYNVPLMPFIIILASPVLARVIQKAYDRYSKKT